MVVDAEPFGGFLVPADGAAIFLEVARFIADLVIAREMVDFAVDGLCTVVAFIG